MLVGILCGLIWIQTFCNKQFYSKKIPFPLGKWKRDNVLLLLWMMELGFRGVPWLYLQLKQNSRTKIITCRLFVRIQQTNEFKIRRDIYYIIIHCFISLKIISLFNLMIQWYKTLYLLILNCLYGILRNLSHLFEPIIFAREEHHSKVLL